MSATHVLISLLGEIALLLWGIRTMSAAMQKALGPRLHEILAAGTRTRLRAVFAGLGVTALLQSSTATALTITAFTATGLMGLTGALAVMLGANIGTTLIIQVASFDSSAIFPLCLLVGLGLQAKARRAAVREIGGALFGLGIILLSLHLLVGTMEPLGDVGAFRDFMAAATGDPLLAILLSAAFTWAAHSSVAGMLFVVSLAGSGIIGPQAALAMVLGANLGTALNPLVAQLGSGDPARLRLPVGNLLNRVVGCALVLPFLPVIAEALFILDPSPRWAAANFHLAFNVAMALLFIVVLPLVARLLETLLPARSAADDPGAPRYLDPGALATPSVALSNAAREAMRMADVIRDMLAGAREAFREGDLERVAAIRRMDDTVDRLFRAIQRYLGALERGRLDEDESHRLADTLAFIINVEHMGDIIDHSLLELAEKRVRAGLSLPDEIEAEISQMHARLLDHLQLAITVFMVGDREAARDLMAEKEAFRDIERKNTRRHMRLIGTGDARAIAASALQLDITRDLKRIEAHIAATVYRLLEQTGQLRESRLRGSGGAPATKADDATTAPLS